MENYGYQPDENNVRPFTITRFASSRQVAPSNYLVTSGSTGAKSKPTIPYKRLSQFLLLIAILLLVGLVALLILYYSTQPKICTSDECLRTATNLRYSLDPDVDPCDDFYQFCCGKWSEEHPNHGWYSSFSTFATISEKIVLESINVFTSTPHSDEPVAVNQSRSFYKSCMDTDTLDDLGLTVLFKYLRKTGLPLVPSFFTGSSTDEFDWLKIEANIKQTLAMDVFIGFVVDANIFNRSQNVMYVGVPYQQCPLPSPLKRRSLVRKTHLKYEKEEEESDEDKDEDETLVRAIRAKLFKFVVKEVMKNVSLAMPEENVLENAANIVNDFSEYLDELAENYTIPDGEESEQNTYAVDFHHLQLKTNETLPEPPPNLWLDYVTAIFKDTNVTVDPQNDRLYITRPEETYLYEILGYVLGEPKTNVELYLWWVTVYAMIVNTSSDIVDYVNRQTAPYYQAKNGNAVFVRSRSLDCSELVNTYMGWAVSYAIADKSFSNNTKSKVERMIGDIKHSFMDHVKNINWMDDYTKKVTLEKSQEMISFVGHPDWLLKPGKLDEYYKGLVVNPDTYLENMMSMIMAFENKTLTSLRIEHKRDWSTEPINVNAFNSFLDNAINVPMAILNFPMYNLGLEYLNYGSIGSVLGHELMHGFDNIGRKHDKYGNYVQWWTNKTIETFENLTECFVKQYENYTLDGVDGHVKGKNTLGENLADNGGINQAFSAYRNFVKEHGEEAKLPGFENFSNFQLFFIAYGSLWCETSTKEDLKNQLENDEHCPNSIRVKGSLENSEDFSRTFGCRKGSKMNPDREKCKIW